MPSRRQPHSWLSSPWLILLLLGLLLVVAVPVALYWWLNSEVDDEPQPSGAAPVAQSRPAAEPAPAPAVKAPVVTPPVRTAFLRCAGCARS